MKELEKVSGVEIPLPIRDIEKKPVIHKNVIEKTDIKDFVKKQLLK